MTRSERSEYCSIRRTIKQFAPPRYGTQLAIRMDASPEFKRALHDLYTPLGFHPASVRTDPRWFDDHERIIYIYGLTWSDGSGRSRCELYTPDELARFASALK